MKSTTLKALFITVISLLSVNLIAQSAEADATSDSHQLTERYPLPSIDRPGIMPTGIIQADLKAKMTALKTINLRLDTTFGIVKDLQGEFGYDGLNFMTSGDKKFEAERTVNLAAKYNYLAVPHVSFSAKASLPIHIVDGEIIKDIKFGLPITFYNSIMAGGILGDIFHLTMREQIAMDFNFPFWYGVQVYGNFWAAVNSSFGSISMEYEEDKAKWTPVPFWTELPVELEATYAFNHYFDLTAIFGFNDVFKAKESMVFGLTFSTRAGRLFG